MRRAVAYMKQNAVGFLALFVALGGTGAYAANTIRSSDIVDGEVTSADVANQNLTGGDIKDNSISSFDVGSLVGDDVVDGTLTGADIAYNSLSYYALRDRPESGPRHRIGTSGEVGFQSGWVNYGGGYTGASYRHDSVGVVRLEGVIKGGTPGPGNPIFYLQGDDCPGADRIFPVSSGNSIARLTVDVFFVSGSGYFCNVIADNGSSAYLSLDGVEWDASQG